MKEQYDMQGLDRKAEIQYHLLTEENMEKVNRFVESLIKEQYIPAP